MPLFGYHGFLPHLANQIGVVYGAILTISCAENVTENTKIKIDGLINSSSVTVKAVVVVVPCRSEKEGVKAGVLANSYYRSHTN